MVLPISSPATLNPPVYTPLLKGDLDLFVVYNKGPLAFTK